MPLLVLKCLVQLSSLIIDEHVLNLFADKLVSGKDGQNCVSLTCQREYIRKIHWFHMLKTEPKREAGMRKKLCILAYRNLNNR